MRRNYLTLICILLIWSNAYSQQTINAGHLQTIHDFVEGYNTQDYVKMRNTMSGIMKAVLSKNTVTKLYTYQYQLLGNVEIANITSKTEGSYAIDLKYERDTTELQRLRLSISKKNRIIGMGSSNPKLEFSKTNATNSISEETIKHKLDSLVNFKHNAGTFNGCVLIVKNKTTFYSSCLGYSDFENEILLNQNTLFDLASCSKQFTAMAIMILKEQGKLSYANIVQDFLPDFPYKNITIENLLTHTSGLPDYMEMMEDHWDKSKVATNKDVLEYLKEYKPKSSFKPGKDYEYSNTGYVVLALIIEQVSEKSYAEFMSANIFQPLGMKNSRVYNTKYDQNEIVDNYAKGYTYSFELKKFVLPATLPEYDYYRYLDGITGDGAVNTTISDMAIWDNSLREYALVKRETFDEGIKPFQTKKELSDYGYGWELQNADNYENLIYHSGNWGGNITFALHFLDRELSVIILSNNEYLSIQSYAIKIANIMLE